MADKEAGDLERLIQQRINRPSFARTISWEIFKSSSDPAGKSRKRGRHGKSEMDVQEQNEPENTDFEKEDLKDSESEDSEYFSTEEYFNETDSDTDNLNETRTDSKEEELSASFERISIQKNDQERKHGRSKKQKRKRRERKKWEINYTDYAEYTAPFQNADNIEVSVSDICENLVGSTGNVSARVPSLFEVCTKSLWARSSRLLTLSYHLLPRPLKQAMSAQRHSQAFASLQLSCLYQSLAEVEKSIKYAYQYEEYETHLLLGTVWTKEYARRETSCESFYQFTRGSRANEVTLIIPYFNAMCTTFAVDNDCRDRRKLLYAFSLMVSVLDLMMPVHIRPSRKKKPASIGDEEDLAIVSCVNLVLDNLHKRYPDLVKLYRHRCLPYIFWLRGHSKLALKHFLQLSESAKDVVEKVYYLLEGARLCQYQHQAESTRRLFRQSQEMLSSTKLARADIADMQEIEEEILMLCANTYDQGVLTDSKASESLSAWRYLTSVPCKHAASFMAAADSILCFHLAHLPGKTLREKIEGVLRHVEVCSQHCTAVCLHLSLLYALLGKRLESCDAFFRLVQLDTTPGLQFKPRDVYASAFTPWQAVLDCVSTRKHAPSILTVVWRTQPGLLRVVKDMDVSLGHQYGRDGGLRLSPEGHLTDDLHLLLPPVRAVNFDLYTGKLILPTNPGQSQTLKTVFQSWKRADPADPQERDQVYSNGSYALTSTELYGDETGRQLHLLATMATSVMGGHTTVAQLQLSSPGNHRCKLNLRQALLEPAKKFLVNQIPEEFIPGSCDNVRAMQGLEYARAHNVFIVTSGQAADLGKFLNRIETEKLKVAKGKQKSRVVWAESNLNSKVKEFAQYRIEVKDFVSFGHTVLLYMHIYTTHCYMFIDVSSKESFTSPVVHFARVRYNEHALIHILGRQGHRVPWADVLCMSAPSKVANKISFYGQGGKELNHTAVDLQYSQCQCVLGSSVYRIENLVAGHNSQDVVPTLTEIRFHRDTETEIFLYNMDPELQQVKRVADYLLVVRSSGLQVLNPSTMEPMPLLLQQNGNMLDKVSGDSTTLMMCPHRVSVLTEKVSVSTEGSPVTLVPVAVNDHLLVFSIHQSSAGVVEIVFCVPVPGHTTEVCFVSHTVGYLISTTHHHTTDSYYYRETVCQLSSSGQLVSILPCLGPGPRSFCPVLLPPPSPCPEEDENNVRPEPARWHVYMRDGHEGIISVRLGMP